VARRFGNLRYSRFGNLRYEVWVRPCLLTSEHKMRFILLRLINQGKDPGSRAVEQFLDLWHGVGKYPKARTSEQGDFRW